MRALRAVLLGGCLVVLAGCEPDLNDNECDTDQDCTYKPGTVCSPENWCVLPVEARPDPPTQDAMSSADAAAPAADMASPAADMAPPATDMAPPAADMAPPATDMAPPAADMAPPIADQGPAPADAAPPPVEADAGPLPLPDAAPAPDAAPVNMGPDTADVFTRLQPSCDPCHTAGAEARVAYLASEMAFVDLVVNNSAFVSPGNPDDSLLVQLLEGTAEGNFTQMPLADAFINLEAAGETQITMAEIRLWISEL